MNKSYNIKEVSKLFNITTNKIRFYEEKGLIKPIRGVENDYRIFTDDHVMRLQAILLYRTMGLSIEAIRDIFEDDTSENYLSHFNRQWELVNNEIHRLTAVRESLEGIIDSIYEGHHEDVSDGILKVAKKTYELNEIKNNWKDRWNFDNWARTYDKSVREDRGALKIYENYEEVLDTVFQVASEEVVKNSHILDIGVGTGNLSARFLKNGYDIIGIDQSREMLSVTKEKYPNLKVRLGEFLKIPFNNKSFDIIVSTYAFHHLNEEEKVVAISEMMRVLRSHGRIVIGDLMFENRDDEDSILKNS